MKDVIREKRKLFFTGKRITPQIVRDISELIELEVNKLKPKKNEYYLMYSIDAKDNTSFESQSPAIFSEGGLIEKRVIESISMEFHTNDHSKIIEVHFNHSLENSNSENYIAVSGDNSNWVNGILQRLAETVDASEMQPKWIKYLGFTILIFCGLFLTMYFRILNSSTNIKELSGSIWILLVMLIPISILVSFRYFYNYISNLYPSIELQTGPKHAQRPQINRRKTQFIIVTILIPLVLSFIYDLIK